ncbi:SDR family NAD(P)-dependent oxidoreductase [Jutongia sp.]|uniref:SDR family NAD(P)-dependent oxidoreductase n=2 Tax=Jutongia sp. TaxID=2944204 RepID=UPI003078C558
MEKRKNMLSGKIAVVTGATRGIGKEIVYQYADSNAVVYAIGRDKKSLAEIDCYAENIHSLELDITQLDSVKKVLMDIYKKENKIDILVNNAGVMNDALLGMISEDMIQEMFNVNVFSVIQMTQLVSRFMKRQKNGCIINIASIVGIEGNAGQSVYSATKGAVISFTKSAAKELASNGIRVNAIAPGIIDTSLLDNVPEEKMKQRLSAVCMGRIGQPGDIAKAALFLAGSMSEYISGQVIRVDGLTIM